MTNRMEPRRVGHSYRVVTVCLGVMTLCCRSTSSSKPAQDLFVHSLEFDTASQKALAERAKQIGNRMYPRVCALLSDGKCQSPPSFDIQVKPRLPNGNMGQTRLRTILLN